MVLPAVYQWKSVVKFGGITSGTPLEYQWYSNGLSAVLVYQWKSAVKFGSITTVIH